jgi:ABC-type antimicrobial peptide transport system permease subunit
MNRLFAFLRRSRADIRADVDAELRFHLDTRVEELVAGGVTRDRAIRQAAREFGDLDDARRYMQRMDARTEVGRRRRDYMGEFRQDLRHTFRQLRSAPAFAATAILTLALGIGANTAIFSVVNAVLFRPLGFPDPDRLYAVYSANRTANSLQGPVSPVDLDDWRAQRDRVEDLGGYFYSEGSTGVDMTGRGQPRRLAAVFITPGFLPTLGVVPAHGRLPREDELVRGGPHFIAVLSHGFWRQEFGGDPAVVGTSVSLNGRPYQIVGVLPEAFRFPTDQADLFIPYSTIPDSGIPRIRPVRLLSVVARAKPGVTEAAVQAEMNAIAARLAATYPEDRAWDSTTVRPLHDVVTGPVRRGLFVLFGAVGFVLLAACVNVASLQLARAVGRRREMGLRVALGARRGRLVRQLLTESLVLSMLGCVAGIALAKGIVMTLLSLAETELPRAAEVQLDAQVLAFSVALAVLTGLAFGLLPALRTSSSDVQDMLREGGRHTGGPASHRLRAGLVIVEVALAVILVAGAGLMGRSLAALLHVDSGFRPDHLVAVQFTISPDRHEAPAPAPSPPTPAGSAAPGPAAARAPAMPGFARFYEQVIQKVRTLPGVVSAAAVKDPPFRGNGERNGFGIPARPAPPGQDPPSATMIHVSDGYFATIGARLMDGREFTPQDRVGTPLVVVVNEAFGRRYFPGERVVGQKILAGRTPIEIVGVVNDIRQVAVSEPAQPTIYISNLQNGRVKTTIVARTAAEPLATAAAIREAIWSLDPAQPITAIFTFDDAVSRALARPRLLSILLASFGAIGLGLGAVGLYGMLAFLVQQRRREIGVRLSLGARPSDVRSMFVRRGFVLTLAGLALGLTAAALLSRSLVSVLYGVGPTDPATFGGVVLALLTTAAAATWLPARRAANVDPVETLRSE